MSDPDFATTAWRLTIHFDGQNFHGVGRQKLQKLVRRRAPLPVGAAQNWLEIQDASRNPLHWVDVDRLIGAHYEVFHPDGTIECRTTTPQPCEFDLLVPASDDAVDAAFKSAGGASLMKAGAPSAAQEVGRFGLQGGDLSSPTLMSKKPDPNVGPAIVLRNNGPDAKRWTLVIMGDGFTAKQEDKDLLEKTAEKFLEKFETTLPFSDFKEAMNVYMIHVVSHEAGADDPRNCPDEEPKDKDKGNGDVKDTYFGASYCTNKTKRLLTVDSKRALDVAKSRVESVDQVLVIVNHEKYGGAGGRVAVCSREETSAQIAIHEIAHSELFNLTDEYTNTSNREPPVGRPNFAASANLHDIPWASDIPPGTPLPTWRNPNCSNAAAPSAPEPPPAPNPPIGAYEGGGYRQCKTYRPYPTCKMNRLSNHFCPVCAKVIGKELGAYLRA